MLPPQLFGFAQGNQHETPVRLLPVVSGLKRNQPLHQRRAPLQVLLPREPLRLEIFATGLVRLARSFLESLPVGLEILARSLAQGAPLLLQTLDALGQHRRVEG